MGSNITLVLTACGRNDLLKETLDSFIRVQCGGAKPDRAIIVEDGVADMPEWLRENIHYYSANLGKVEYIRNDRRRGQIYSIDKAYSLVKTDYVFHLEEDWRFDQSGNFLQESKSILEKYPKIIQVSLRGDTGWHRLIDQPPYEGFKICMPYWNSVWGGLSFNPGLRRLADYKKIGSYGQHTGYGTTGLGHEKELSKMYLDMGFRMADLNRPIVTHIGGAFSRSLEQSSIPMPKILIAIPVCHKFDYGKWESGDSPSFNRANAYNGEAYGSGIHISGDNNRIQALRDTWLKDVEKFKSHVDYKLFYGAPHDRQAEPDEVFLNVPDDYGHLPAKTIAICKYAKEHGYDYLFKADDDSLVYVDRLIRECLTATWDYAGHLNGRVCTGGPGYWLSHQAFSIIADKASPNFHWAEDVTVSHFLFHNNISGVNLEGHKSGRQDHWVWPDGKFNPDAFLLGNTVVAHAVQPNVMREWYAAKGN